MATGDGAKRISKRLSFEYKTFETHSSHGSVHIETFQKSAPLIYSPYGISHFAVILSQFENSVIFRYSKIYKKSSEISVALCCPKSKNFQDADSKILWGVTGMFWEACALFVDFRNRFLAISRDPSTSGSKMLHF